MTYNATPTNMLSDTVFNADGEGTWAVFEPRYSSINLFFADNTKASWAKLKEHHPEKGAGVYLLKGEQHSYVGKSQHLYRRIGEHHCAKKVEFTHVLVLIDRKLLAQGLDYLEAKIFQQILERGIDLDQVGLESRLSTEAHGLVEQEERVHLDNYSRIFLGHAQLLGLVPARGATAGAAGVPARAAAAGAAGPAVPTVVNPSIVPRSEADRVVVQVACKSYRQLLIAVAESLWLNGMSLQQFRRHWNGAAGKALNVVDGKDDPQWITPWNQAHWGDPAGPTPLLARSGGPSGWICNNASADDIKKHFESFWRRLSAERVDFKMNVQEWPKGDASMGRLEFSFDLKKLSS